ncbi:BlaR1 peptidase M56 [Prosthecobacter fusiformis]|uniref:BlaR1 peptidase M56 n=1 Tax=Prosthecobacter fusiformis TaxID=48464 RepID=A0A4V3FI81_9BACT|nr:M56 family metallopeptidase [Prosthecobacter fusiformis]TDU81393.1 BlaR1 peptidase M56 [Prosthecobacter fusiformis]
MLWFHSSVTLLLLLALGLGYAGLPRRRVIETMTLLVVVLPVLSLGLELVVPVQLRIGGTLAGLHDSWHAYILSFPLTVAWVAGIMVQTILLIRRWDRVKRLIATSSPLPNDSVSMIASCLGQSEDSIRRHFKISRFIKTPLVLPGMTSVVILPGDWDSWPMRLRMGALRHEWHHFRHHDAVWNVWMSMFQAVLWFHPLAWLSVKTWTDACEIQADMAAIGTNDPADYAQDLLGIAKLQPFALTGATCFLGSSRGGLHRRIQSLLSVRRRGNVAMPLILKLTGPLLIFAFALMCAWMGTRDTTHKRDEAMIRLSAEAFPADL